MAASRVAALYDIHGNLPALEAVLAEVDALAPELVVVGGDVAAGPMPAQTLDRLMALGDRARFLRGNADREVVEAFDQGRPSTAFSDVAARATTWTAQHIAPEHRDFLASFEESVSLDLAGLGPTLFCHGSPRSDEEIIAAVTPEERLTRILGDTAEDVVVCGHTHHQFDRRAAGKRVVNAGSVGMPYEGRPGAFWLLIDGEVQLRRTDYDVEAAIAAMRESGFRDVDEHVRESLLEPVGAEEVAEFFERVGRERDEGRAT
jgi:predicted phosphodiesterase